MKDEFIRKAYCKRVVDGDTYDMAVDLGFQTQAIVRVRLKDCDTPETWRPKSESERKHGEAATKFVKERIEGKTVFIKSYKLGIYGRYEADVWYYNDSLAPDVLNLKDSLEFHHLIKLENYEN